MALFGEKKNHEFPRRHREYHHSRRGTSVERSNAPRDRYVRRDSRYSSSSSSSWGRWDSGQRERRSGRNCNGRSSRYGSSNHHPRNHYEKHDKGYWSPWSRHESGERGSWFRERCLPRPRKYKDIERDLTVDHDGFELPAEKKRKFLSSERGWEEEAITTVDKSFMQPPCELTATCFVVYGKAGDEVEEREFVYLEDDCRRKKLDRLNVLEKPSDHVNIEFARGGLNGDGVNRRVDQLQNKSKNEGLVDVQKQQARNINFGQPRLRSEDHVKPKNQSVIHMFGACRSVLEYEIRGKVNEGAYGVVYKAANKKTGTIVVLKKIKMSKGDEASFQVTTQREIELLSSLHHPNVVNLKEVVTDGSNNIFLVMEHMDYDVCKFMKNMRQPFSTSEVKCMMQQLLEGVGYLHENNVLHRDLKTANLLLNKEGQLKICDFGLSRRHSNPLKPYTPLVVTLWYRAPELLLGTKKYSTEIDMWSVGCIMAELLSGKPIFPGKTELHQLEQIYKILGVPDEDTWPGLSKLQGTRPRLIGKQQGNLLPRIFQQRCIRRSLLSDSGLDLLKKLLTYDPKKRVTARAALNHCWFREFPLAKYDFKPVLPVHL